MLQSALSDFLFHIIFSDNFNNVNNEIDMDNKKNADNPKSFEESLAKLTKIVEQLENQSLPLEEVALLYEQGKELELYCRQELEKIQLRIKKITDQNADSVTEDNDL